MNYFAYGSNMCTRRLAARVSSARPLGPATLAGHIFGLDLMSSDGSAKCNIAATGRRDDVVHGVCFEIDASQLEYLHAAEGPAYEFVWLDVLCGGSTINAAVYRGLTEYRDTTRQPYQWYLDYVLAGAREHRLSGEWIDSLAAYPATIDPDAERRQSNHNALSVSRSA
ncbi:gamma-glutamylcyclotransferase family protein [Salinisphaera orenii]|uniref:gamma-glutamylcyclotransferase family protein n=1 Tax=Salinisphaera orenii TaxID=856731 RepID=UPI000DBE7D82